MTEDVLFRTTPTQTNDHEMQIGNEDGLRTLRDLRRTHERLDVLENDVTSLRPLEKEVASLRQLKEDVASLRESVSILQGYEDDVIKMRRGILDEWSNELSRHKKSKQLAHQHNEVAHGANILADRKAIQQMEDIEPDRALRWKAAFTSKYGLSYTHMQDDLRTAPGQVIETFNMLVNMKTLH